MSVTDDVLQVMVDAHVVAKDFKKHLHLCQMAEDHSERIQPYEGDAGDETA